MQGPFGKDEMGSLYICNARIVRPVGASQVADLEIIDGIITGMAPVLGRRPGIDVYDAGGLSMIPALIDLHVHSTSINDLVAYAATGVGHIRYAGVDLEAVRGARRFIRTSGLGLEIHSCGPMLDMPEVAYPSWTRPVTSVKEARDAARELIATGEVDALIVTQRVTLEVARGGSRGARGRHTLGWSDVGDQWRRGSPSWDRPAGQQLAASSCPGS